MPDFIKTKQQNYFIIRDCFFICFILAFFILRPAFSMAAGIDVVLNDPAVSCNNSNVQVDLAWSSTIIGTPTYYVLRKIQGDPSFAQIGDTNNIFYTDTTAVSGKTYIYQIRAEKGSNIYYSGEKTVLPVYCPPTYLPSTKSCQADGPHINLAWAVVSGDLSTYEIYRKDPGETVFSLLPTGSYTAASYNNGPNLIGAGSYYYYIKSIWQDGHSAFINTNTEEIAPACPPTLALAASCLSNTAPGGPIVSLSWNKLRGVQKYQIYRQAPGQTSPSLLTEIFNEATINYDDKLAESLPGSYYQGGKIYYNVKAVWPTEQKDSNVQQIDISQCAPFLAVTNNCDIFSMMLSWTAVKGATHYNIYRDGTFIFQSTGIANTTYTDGLDLVSCPGQICAHQYSVQAILSVGSPLVSNVVSSSIDCATIIPPAPAPDIKVSNSFAFCDNGKSKIKLEWQPANNVTYYTVYRNGAGVVNLLGTSYFDSGVQSGYSYTYSVTAFGKGGTFIGSQNSYSAAAVSCLAPSVPTLSLTAACNAGAPFIKLSWIESANAYGYEIYRGVSAGNLNLLTTFDETAPEFTSRIFQDNNVLPATAYYYKIIARGPAGTGEDGLPIQSESAINSKTTFPCLPTTPAVTLSKVCVLGAPKVNLSWITDKANTVSYEIFRKDVSETVPIKIINDTNTTAWQDSAVAPLSSYEYKVEAVGSISTSRATEGYKFLVSYNCSLPGPFTLNDAVSCQGSYPMTNLSWVDSSNATSYDLYRNLLNFDDSIAATTNIYSITTPPLSGLGSALKFNGDNDYVVAGSTNRPTNTFTFEAWVKAETTHEIDSQSTNNTLGISGQKYVFWPEQKGWNAGAGLSVGANGISVYEHGNSYMPALAVYSGNIGAEWNHIVIVYNNKTPSIYLNGNLVKTGYTSTMTTIYAPVQFGGGYYGYHKGFIDEVRIYSRALTLTEIQEHSQGIFNNETGLAGLWHFNEGGGQTVFDSSSNANNGTLGSALAADSNDPAWITKNFIDYGFGNGLKFDGINDYVNAPLGTQIGNNNPLSVEAWVYIAANTNGPIIGITNSPPGGGWNMPFLSVNGTTVYGWLWGVNGNNPLSYTAGTGWHHLMITYTPLSGGQEIFYVDGIPVANGTGQYSSAGATVYWTTYISGAKPAGVNSLLNGIIDEVHIYNRTLNSTEAKEHYQGIYSNESGLVGLWHLDEGWGQTISDSSNYGNNGTLGSTSGVDANDPAWVKNGLQSNIRYNWQAKATGPGGSTLSNTTNPITLSDCPPTKPGLKLEPICSAPGVSAINLSWSYPYVADKIEIYREGEVDPIKTVANNTNPVFRKFTDNNSGAGLTGLASYTYWAKAINPTGRTDSDHLAVTAQACIVPAKPENLTQDAAAVCGGAGNSYPQVKLNWDASLNASYYTVYRNSAIVGQTTTNSFADTYSNGIRVNNSYQYYIRPFSVDGLPGPDSDVKVITTGYCTPSTLSLSALTTSCVSSAPANTLVWSDATDFNTANYEIYRDGTAPINKIATIAKGTLNYADADPNLLPSTNYNYYIKAIGPTGFESPIFTSKSIITYSCGQIPAAPALNLDSINCEDNIPHAKFSWGNAANAYSYNLYRNFDAGNLIYPTVKSVLLDHGDYALEFNGSNNYINCGNNSSLKIINSQTYEFWIKPYDFGARRNPINKAYGGEGTITIETNGALSYYWGIAGADGGTYQGHGSSITIAANTWTHVVHVRDTLNKTMVWYFNGVANSPRATDYNSAVASANNLLIGSGYAGPIYGQMDGVRIYARALTAAEVSEHYQGVYKNETELRGVWHFNEGSGSIASDSSGKGNNGSLINMNNDSWKFPSTKPNFIAPLQSNKTYKYKIKAMGVDKESAFSNEVEVNTPACLTAPALANNDICDYYNKPITLLYWPNQKSVTEYKLYKDGALLESKAPVNYISSDGFIKHWLLIGGFSYAGTDAAATLASLNTDYLGGELKVKPRAGESIGGKTWFDYNAPNNNIDFTLNSSPMSNLSPKEYASAYAFAYVYSPIAQAVQLRIGSDDGVKVFLNGAVIYTNNTQRGASPDQDIKPINLVAGINTLLIKVQQGAGGWGLYARITDNSGNNAINYITTWDSASAFGNNPIYKVKAKILDEETDFSNLAISTPPNCLPADPGLTVASQCDALLSPQIVLKWSPDPNNQTAYWSIYQKREGESSVELLKISPPTISYTVTNIESGINYEYHLEARGITTITLSSLISAQALFCYPPPEKPVVIVAPLCAGYTPRMRIDWSATANTVFYDVLRKNLTAVDPGFSNLFTGLSSATLQKVDINVDEASTYQYIIKAIGNGTGNSNSSDPSAETAALACSSIPPSPSVLSLNSVVSTGDYVFVSLGWADSGNEEKYEVIRNGANIKTLVQGVDYSDGDLVINYLDNTVVDGASYDYKILAINVNGETNSNIVTVPVPIAVPGGFALTDGYTAGWKKIYLKWTEAKTTAAGGNVFYQVLRGSSSSFAFPSVICAAVVAEPFECYDNHPSFSEKYYKAVAVNNGGITDSNLKTIMFFPTWKESKP